MRGAGGKNSWALFLLLLTGIVLGGFIGMLAEGVPALSWLGYGQTFGLDTPIVVNLGLLVITFGLTIKITIAKRLSKASAGELLSFENPDSIARYYMEDLRHEKQEIMKLLMLNSKSKLIGETNISKGTVNASLITPRELFIEALQKNAVFVIILHNHPSGEPTPSREDRLITRRIQDAGALIGIELLDHIIIGNNCYVSFREEGML